MEGPECGRFCFLLGFRVATKSSLGAKAVSINGSLDQKLLQRSARFANVREGIMKPKFLEGLTIF